MARNFRREKGNMLAMSLALSVVLMILAFAVLSYNFLISTHKQVQTSADAAALEAVKQIIRVTVSTPMGEIGLVDLNPADTFNPLNTANSNNQRPVIGYNTALATVRLDLLIAKDLKNSDMEALALDDLSKLKSTGKQLGDKIAESVATGGTIWKAVKTIYESNNRKSANSSGLFDFKIIPGRLKTSTSVTNIPIPSPADSDATANSISGKYKPNINIPVGTTNFVFAAVGEQPALVESKDFVAYGDGEYSIANFGILPPSVVRIQAYNNVTAFADTSSSEQEKKKVKQLYSESAAEAGTITQNFRSSAYCIGFQGGLPNSTEMSSMTIKDIMDYSSWSQPKQEATWLKPSQGDYPGYSMAPSEFRTGKGMMHSPSTALAYGLYDWLRSLGIRVKRSSAVTALSAPSNDLRTLAKAGGSSGNWTKFACLSENPDAMPIDPTYQALRDNTQAGSQYYTDTVNYKAADEAMYFGGDPITGQPIPPRGNSIIEECQLIEGLLATNRAGITSCSAGIMALIEADQAADFISGPSGTLGTDTVQPVIAPLMVEIVNDSGSDTLLPHLITMQGAIGQYLNMPALKESPPAASVKQVFNDFMAEKITATNCFDIRNKYKAQLLDQNSQANLLYVHNFNYAGNEELKRMFWIGADVGHGGIEFLRMREAENRAYRVTRNGQSISHSTSGVIWRLKQFGAKCGIRRVDGHDMYPTSPVFVHSIIGPQPGALLTVIMPNNEPTVIRNGPSARPKFFNYEQPTLAQVKAFHHEILQMNFEPGMAAPKTPNQLLCGSKRMPMHWKIPDDKKYCWDAFGWPFVVGWTTETTAPAAHYGSYIGWWSPSLTYLPQYLAGGTTQTNIILSPAAEPVANPPSIKSLVDDVMSYGKIKKNKPLFGSTPLESDVFILNMNSSGDVKISYVNQPGADPPRYPFSGHLVRKNQALYFSGKSFRKVAPSISTTPTAIYRDVMARDQFCDLTNGEGYQMQSPSTWCHQGFGLMLNFGNHDCPLMAGEWLMSNPYSTGCCSIPNNDTDYKETVHGAPYYVSGATLPPDPTNKAICPKWLRVVPFDGVKYFSTYLED